MQTGKTVITVMILSFLTDRSGQIVQTSLFAILSACFGCITQFSSFRMITAKFSCVQKFRNFTVDWVDAKGEMDLHWAQSQNCLYYANMCVQYTALSRL